MDRSKNWANGCQDGGNPHRSSTDGLSGYARINVLASDEASYVTGALWWLADGGVTLAKGAVGEDTPQDLRSEPSGELHLDPSLEGLKNKRTHAIKK
ncbi:MAG TPA: hypothetical protein V6D28_01365 [Leptolyngbyaceae cyanobacterium]